MMLSQWGTRLIAIGGMLAVFALAQDARAVGTAAGEDIVNRASVSFTVLGSGQTVESSPTGNSTPGAGAGTDTLFMVDRRVDLTVSELSSGYTTVLAGQTQQVLGFRVTNTGNDTFDIDLSTFDQSGGAGPFGGTDNFDAIVSGAEIYLDDGSTAGVLDAGDTAATAIDDLVADDGSGTVGTAIVWVVRNIPSTGPGSNLGDLSVIHLVAEARDATTGGALPDNTGDNDDPALVQNVFADGAGTAPSDAASDARHSGDDGYLLEVAELSITKSSQVVSDPTGAVAPLAKAIPGAVIEYTITIDNTGSAQATNVTLTDDLTLEIATNGTVAFDADAYGIGQGVQLEVNGGGATPLTNAADVDAGQFVGNVVTVGGVTLDAGQNAVVNFRVVIQ